MQNKLIKIAQIGFALIIFSFGALPALAQELSCADAQPDMKNITPESIRSKLKDGFNINQRSPIGGTMLHVVSACSGIEAVSFVLQAGGNVHARDKEFGFIPLHFAALLNTDPEVITALVVSRSNVNARDKERRTPLHYAAANNTKPEMIMILLQAGASGALLDEEGKTAFNYAEENKALKDTEAYWALHDAQY